MANFPGSSNGYTSLWWLSRACRPINNNWFLKAKKLPLIYWRLSRAVAFGVIKRSNLTKRYRLLIPFLPSFQFPFHFYRSPSFLELICSKSQQFSDQFFPSNLWFLSSFTYQNARLKRGGGELFFMTLSCSKKKKMKLQKKRKGMVKCHIQL